MKNIFIQLHIISRSLKMLAPWRLLPDWSWLPFGLVLSLAELVLALWLFSGWHLAQAATVSVSFHLGYTAGTAPTLLRGISLPDCGCFGMLFTHPLDWPMAVEDATTALLSVVLYGIALKWKPRLVLTLLALALVVWVGVIVWKKSSLLTTDQNHFRGTRAVRRKPTNIKTGEPNENNTQAGSPGTPYQVNMK